MIPTNLPDRPALTVCTQLVGRPFGDATVLRAG
jgi:hypothetical protein